MLKSATDRDLINNRLTLKYNLSYPAKKIKSFARSPPHVKNVIGPYGTFYIILITILKSILLIIINHLSKSYDVRDTYINGLNIVG